MAETEQITVADTSDGVGGNTDPGRPVNLPVVELLTGRGFITGKSGSGKSNSASVIAEKLLDNGFGLLIVDIDGEYYGLKEEYEILHVGGDEECDIQVTEDHAGKIASLALEQNVPIILDISSFLDEEAAETLLTEVAKQLFAKAKKQKQPFLMLVEECHEWMPEKGSMGEVGKMLIKIGKRGRKHGLGIVGISQRPADVKKDYITQCDWLVWHRLTWNNDTKVVGRILDSTYADAVEDLADGEAFLMTDWAEAVHRVQFRRKQTFDAGATPGLDDFERPELKSVSEDLVSELETISEEQQATENRIQELREELDEKNSRIAELERELQDARDLSRMAEQFTEALVDHVDDYNPGRTAKEEERRRQDRFTDAADGQNAGDDAAAENETPETPSGGGFGDAFGDFVPEEGMDSPPTADANGESAGADAVSANGHGDGDDAESAFAAAMASVGSGSSGASEQADAGGATAQSGTTAPAGDAAAPIDPIDGSVPEAVADLAADIADLEGKTRQMLSFYVEQGPGTPLNAHFSAGGSGDRTAAYARNRTLRLRGLVEHVGRGSYDVRLDQLLDEETATDLPAEQRKEYADRLEGQIVDTEE
ncbi:helicase HerA domain-containing protein [Haloarcula halophila]|uniref:helicase HerA domain-containing protein n=1 Tax=Haloarcula TaxID=2237 RepID=UPI0023E45A02|nr:DUF87 domain-containing protein [Halomicroarcula sp. DFY41]